MKLSLGLFIYCLLMLTVSPLIAAEPVRLGVVGLTHTHVHWIFESDRRFDDFEIVGIVEPNRDLARRYSEQHGFDMALVHDSLDAMLDSVKPDGVTAFGTILDHRSVVEAAAPRGIHVMVEKPLAISLTDASVMGELAEQFDIHLLTNYETSWYSANHAADELLAAGALGPLRKAVFHHGHQGPLKLGINQEFLDWLIDPAFNGAGALMDFGCYGANLMTWLTKGQRPLTVTAVTQQLQPDLYPLVDDEATIIVTYPDAQAIIQASWNWPRSRKDMELYGVTGQLMTQGSDGLVVQTTASESPEEIKTPALKNPSSDPFTQFAAIIRGELILPAWDAGNLDNNLLTMEILQAAMDSARLGQTVTLNSDRITEE